MNHKYDDIIDLPHHVSLRRAGMPMADRAAQFAPFAALTGYEAVIEETGRLTDSPAELSDGVISRLNEQLWYLSEHSQEKPTVTVSWFVPDEKKAGGSYKTVTGQVKRVEEYEKYLLLTDGTKIPLQNICRIETDMP